MITDFFFHLKRCDIDKFIEHLQHIKEDDANPKPGRRVLSYVVELSNGDFEIVLED